MSGFSHYILLEYRIRHRFNIAAIEKTVFEKKVAVTPGDLSFLVNHLRELPEDARKFIIWASFFPPM